MTTKQIKEGDKLPDFQFTECNPGQKVSVNELFTKGTNLLFGLPGAFTPGCSRTHLPGYVLKFDEIKSKGVNLIACVSVNDAFVMEAWGKSNNCEGKIRMLADASGEFTKAIGMDLDLTEALGNVRSKRYSMIIKDGVVHKLFIEPDGKGLTCSLAPEILKFL